MSTLMSPTKALCAVLAAALAGAVFFAPPAGASLATVKKSVTHVAGPFETEDSARAIAKEKAKRLVLGEVGKLLDRGDDVTALLAVIVAVDTAREMWDGRQYFAEAVAVVDERLLRDEIGRLEADAARAGELRLIRKKADDALAELEALNAEAAGIEEFAGRLRRYEAAVRVLMAVDWTEKGLGALSRGSHTAALDALATAVQLNPDDEFSVYNRGVAHWYLEHFAEAVEDFRRALRINPGYARARDSLQQAERYLRRVESRARYFGRRIAADPEDADAYTERGLALWELGRHDEAAADFTRVIELNPGADDGYVNRGGLYMSQGRYADAVADFEAALKAEPKSAIGHFNLGLAYIRLGRLEEAAAAFGRVIELDPEDAEARFNRGAIHMEMGNREEAVQDMKAAAALGHSGAAGFLASSGIEAPPAVSQAAQKPRAPENAPGPQVKYALQAGAFRDLRNADSFSMSLKSRGYGSYGLGSGSSENPTYLVLVGRYTDREKALAAMRRLKEDDDIDTVLVRVKR